MIVIPLKIPDPCIMAVSIHESAGDCNNNENANIGPHQSIELHNELLALVELRNSLGSFVKSETDRDTVIIDHNLKEACKLYYTSLQEFQHRFLPLSHHDGIQNLKLTWSNACDDDSSNKQQDNRHFDLTSENECILFTLAAAESHLAKSLQPLTSDNSLVKASEHFDLAAGIIALLLDRPKQQNATDEETKQSVIDMSHSTLKFLQSIMLAQSQACNYEIAKIRSSHRLSHHLLSSLAIGCAELFQSALGYIQTNPLLRNTNKGKQWESYTRAKNRQWMGISDYHKGLECKETSFDVAIARFRSASAHVTQSLLIIEQRGYNNDGNADTAFIIEEFKSTYDLVMQARDEVELQHSDQNSTFHDSIVPLRRNLPIIRPRLISKAKLVTENDLSFNSFHKFDVESERMFQEVKGLVEQQNIQAQAYLKEVSQSSSSLPVSSSRELPDALWNKITSIQQQAIIPRLRGKLTELNTTGKKARMMAEELRRELEAEIQRGIAFCKQHPSFPAILPFKDREVKHYLILIENAKKGDAVIKNELDGLEIEPSVFGMLSRSKEEIELMFSQNSKDDFLFDFEGTKTKILASINKGEDLIAEMIPKRPLARRMMGRQLSKMDLPTLSCRSEEILLEHLAFFSQFRLSVETHIQGQQILLTELNKKISDFEESKNESNDNNTQHFLSIDGIDKVMAKVHKILNQVTEGYKFYESLLPTIEGLRFQASQYSLSMLSDRLDFEDREKKANDNLVDNLVAQLVSMGFDADQASDALSQHNSSFDDALNYLLSLSNNSVAS